MPKPGHKFWRLRGSGSDYVVARRWDLEEDEEFVERPTLLAASLDRLLSDPSTARQLAEAAGVGGAFGHGIGPRGLRERDALRARLLDAFRSGELVLMAREAGVTGGSGSSSGKESAASEKGAKTAKTQPPDASAPAPAGGGGATSNKTWIEFQLVDNNGKAIPNERYKAKLTDGSTKDGTLDAGGSVRFSNIDPGTCEISFPDLDTQDWTSA